MPPLEKAPASDPEAGAFCFWQKQLRGWEFFGVQGGRGRKILSLSASQPILPLNRFSASRQPACSGVLTWKALMSAWLPNFTLKILKLAWVA